jgi:hypothetical protein
LSEGEWPDARSCPLRRAGAAAVPLDDNVALYDDVGQMLILLNPSAAAVWDCCDGSTSVEQMVSQLSEAYDADADVVGQDVRQTVRKLRELGLVGDGPAGASAP